MPTQQLVQAFQPHTHLSPDALYPVEVTYRERNASGVMIDFVRR